MPLAPPPFDVTEAHRYFAKAIHGETWKLHDRADRTAEDDSRMLDAAYASSYHWRQVGTPVNRQRAEWLIARVCCVLGYVEAALRHAKLALDLTEKHRDLMEDFDFAFAYEGWARACALAGRRDEAARYKRLALEAGKAIKDEEDHRIFEDDFRSGNWHGVT